MRLHLPTLSLQALGTGFQVVGAPICKPAIAHGGAQEEEELSRERYSDNLGIVHFAGHTLQVNILETQSPIDAAIKTIKVRVGAVVTANFLTVVGVYETSVNNRKRTVWIITALDVEQKARDYAKTHFESKQSAHKILKQA